MRSTMKWVFWVLTLGAASLATPASALVTWNFSSACTSSTSGDAFQFGNTCSELGTGTGVTTAVASAWAFTKDMSGTNNAVDTAFLGLYSGNGLGATNKDGGTVDGGGGGDTNEGTPTSTLAPEHALDNNQRYELILFDLGKTMTGLQVKIGYPTPSQQCNGVTPCDSDLTVLAYTGSGAPTLQNQTVSQLTSAGWAFAGNYQDVQSLSNETASITGGPVNGARYWIVAAYDPALSNTNCPSNTNVTGLSCGDDYVKIFSLAATPKGVPEPGTLLLLGVAGTVGLWRRRRIAHG